MLVFLAFGSMLQTDGSMLPEKLLPPKPVGEHGEKEEGGGPFIVAGQVGTY